MATIEELTETIVKFRDERDWAQFHNAKDLSLALSIEAAELNQLFLWKSPEEANVEKIKEEIEHRKLVVRPEAIEAVKEARAQGDLSENFEYYAAKKDKNKNEGRIRYLERVLKTATIISDESADDEVGLNNTVQVYFEDDDETETFKIVSTMRGDSISGRISSDSPMGAALMGHKVGDRVEVKVNEKVSYYVVIKSIENTGEEETDTIRTF